MGGRVVAVDAAAEHGDRPATGSNGAAMRLAVDAARETADDHDPRRGRLGRQHARDRTSVPGAGTRSDDRDCRLGEELRIRVAPEPEAAGRVGYLTQECRESALAAPQSPDRHGSESSAGER